MCGASVRSAGAPGAPSYRVELPDELAWHWARRGRPCPQLWLEFAEPPDGGARTEAPPAGEGPEAVPPFSRRFWEIRALALDLGWLGVFHVPARRHEPALWMLLEAVADGAALADVPPPGLAAVWVRLSGRPGGPAVQFPAPLSAAQVTPDTGGGPGFAAPGPRLLPGPPPAARLGRPRVGLGGALEQAALAAARAFVAHPSASRWLRPRRSSPPCGMGPRLQLFVRMAALIYLDAGAAWPPPPLPFPPATRPAPDGPPCARAGPAAAPPGPGAEPGP